MYVPQDIYLHYLFNETTFIVLGEHAQFIFPTRMQYGVGNLARKVLI